MTETPQERETRETTETTETTESVTIPANEDVEPGNEPQPESREPGGAQDDMSDPEPDETQEQEPVGEPDDERGEG